MKGLEGAKAEEGKSKRCVGGSSLEGLGMGLHGGQKLAKHGKKA